MKRLRWAYVSLVLLLSAGAWATAAEPNQALRLELFIRSDAENCIAAEAYVREFAAQRGGIEVRVRDLLHDPEAVQRYWTLIKEFGVQKPALPACHACGKLTIGFANVEDSGPAIEALFDIHAYVREGCQHCRDAKRFLADIGDRWPAVRVHLHDIVSEPGARQRMLEVVRRAKQTAAGMPVIAVCGRVFVGYQTDATSGRQIEDLLRKAAKEPSAQARPRSGQGAGHQRIDLRAERWIGLTFRLVEIAPACLALARDDDAEPAAGRSSDPAATNEDRLPLGLPESSTDAPTVYAPPSEEPPTQIEVPWLGTLRVDEWGLPAFTFLVGLIDGFNPCAMWVLVFLLSVLVNVRSRWRILTVAGTFVLVSGLAYYAFMAAWMNTFLLVGVARPLQVAMGVVALLIGAVNVKDFFAFKSGVSLSIPESAKPGIYARVRGIVSARYLSVAVGAAVTLAVMVNMVELLCTAGLPALYTQVLTLQQLPAWQNYLYLGLYIAAYMLDDVILLTVFVVTLSRRKLQEREGRWLKLLSGVVILLLGAVMLFRPDWLYWGANASPAKG